MDHAIKLNIILLIPILICLGLMYIPTWQWMYQNWTAEDSYSSHGFLIPLISGWLLWQNRSKLKELKLQGSWWGIWVLCGALLLHSMSGIARVHFTSGISIIFAVAGLTLFLLGTSGLRWAWFPIFYLFCMIPFPSVLVSQITLQLKLMAAEGAARILEFVGYSLIREGSIIYFSHTQLVVGDVCSGLRSLVSLIALGLPFVYLIYACWWRKILMFIALFPVAFIFNVFRIILLGLVTYYWGPEAASGWVHDFSGILLFVGDLITLWGVYLLLKEQAPASVVAAKSEPTISWKSFFQIPIASGFWFKYATTIVFCGCISVISMLYFYKDYPTENKSYTQGFPNQFASWQITKDFPINYRTIQLLETTDILMRYYRRSNQEPPVLLSMVASSTANRKIAHPPEICYRGAGYEVMRREKIKLDNGIEAILLVVYSGKIQELVLYWYKFGGEYTADYYYHQTNVLFNFLQKQKGGLALIRVSVNITDNADKSLKILQDFVKDMAPLLKDHLPE